MDRKDAIAIVLDLDEKTMRRTLIALVYKIYENERLTKEILFEILDFARG